MAGPTKTATITVHVSGEGKERSIVANLDGRFNHFEMLGSIYAILSAYFEDETETKGTKPAVEQVRRVANGERGN